VRIAQVRKLQQPLGQKGKRKMNPTHKVTGKLLALLLAASISLAGCNAGDGNAAFEEAGQESGLLEDAPQTIDWNSHQVVTAQEAVEGTRLYLREYYEDWIVYPEEYNGKYSKFYKSPAGDFCAQTQYVVYNDDGSFSRVWNCLDYFDMETTDSLHAEIDLDKWGVPKTANLVLADVADDKLIACYFYTSEEAGTPKSYCSLLLYHMEDGVQKILDLLPALTAAGMADSMEPFSEKNFLCDQNGCCYIVLEDKILIISDTGQLLLVAKPEADTAPLTYLCKTPEGLPVFVGMDTHSRSNSYWIYDHTAGEMRSLGKSGYITLKYGCMDSWGNIYHYTSMGKMVRWNTLTGIQENIFDCNANHICSNTTAEKLMAVRGDGDLAVLDPVTEHKSIYVLSSRPGEEEQTLTLVSTCPGTQLEQTAAAMFSMKNPGVSIDFSDLESSGIQNWEEAQAYTANLINRIVAGEAPDMCVVSAQTMRILYEKDVLADLTGAIPDQIQEQVFGCVWNAGTIDGRLMGLSTNISASSILVSDELWSQDTWTLEDILALAENAPKDTLKGLIPLSGVRPLSSDALYWLALRNIDSNLVDRQSKTCHFDSELFRSLLEYCKNTPIPEPNPDNQDPAPARAVREGEYLAYARDLSGFADFSYQMSLFPENYHWVGVPTRGESGSLVNSDVFLVVIQDTEHMDLIRKFLPTLYDDDLERQFPQYCLRRDVLRERVVVPEWDSTVQFNMGEGRYQLLAGKPDGTSYVEEYIAFLDSCVPEPSEDSVIANIVLEEAAPYFAGDKDMDTVISIIQSRVQLYLDESGS